SACVRSTRGQPATPITNRAAAAALTTLAHFIQGPFGLLIREILRTQCKNGVHAPGPTGCCAPPPSQHATAPNLRRECNSKRHFVFDPRQFCVGPVRGRGAVQREIPRLKTA